MTDIDLQLVRECFELSHFQVTTRWALQSDAGHDDHSQQLYVRKADPPPTPPGDLLLGVSDLPRLDRALVEVRVWHTERLYVSTLDQRPVFTEFAERARLGPALDFFGDTGFRKVLVISALPQTTELRHQLLARFEQSAVDHVIEFGTVLQAIVQRVSDDAAYSGSHTLQLMQLLKRYNLVRRQQLEFTFPMEPPPHSDA